MADAKSRFKRPEQPETPTPGTEAEQFIHGTSASGASSRPTADQAAGEVTPELAKGNDQGETTTKEGRMKRLTIDIPATLHKRVKEQCATRETTIAEVVRKYLEKTFPDPERRKGS